MNAILNYAYAVLESQVRMQIAADGYDPTIGFLHTYNMERPALVFDLMEPLRPIVDRSVLEFVQSHTFHPADFTIRSDGVCRINPEMARHVVLMITQALQKNIKRFTGRIDLMSARATPKRVSVKNNSYGRLQLSKSANKLLLRRSNADSSAQ
jgi:CRISPR-associated endonuclease Cas1